MILILAESDDVLAGRVQERLTAKRRPARRLSETELMEETPMAVERDGLRFAGFLRLPEGTVRLDELSGVLVRVPRRWWPSPAFDPADRMFVYHETTAALFCLLAGLRCPVLNRLDLPWWLCDPGYADLLREQLVERLGLPVDCGDRAEPPDGAASVYAVGGRLIPAAAAAPTAGRLASRSRALADWQAESGVGICRLDLVDGLPTAVDPCPSLRDEDPGVAEEVAAAAVELLS